MATTRFGRFAQADRRCTICWSSCRPTCSSSRRARWRGGFTIWRRRWASRCWSRIRATRVWRWKRVKRKTDRDDALKLARLTAMNQLPTVYMPERSTREWRSFIAYRHKLVGRQTAIRNNIRSILLRQGLSMPRGFRAWTQAGVEELDELAHELDGLAMGDLWRGMLKVELAGTSAGQ